VELDTAESVTTIKTQLERLAAQHHLEIRVWSVGRKVYFALSSR
jgi:hypothetical protein